MSSWRSLKHFCDGPPQYGLNLSAGVYAERGVRFIRTSDITGDGGLTSDESAVFVHREAVAETHALRPGDLLFSRSGSLGKCLRYRNQDGAATFAGYLVRFRPRRDASSRYLEYCSRSAFFQQNIAAEAISSTISNFNAERYAALRIPWWPETTQRAIADYLDTETARIDALISKKRALKATLLTRETAHLSALWQRATDRRGSTRLGRLLARLQQGWSPQCEDRLTDPGEYGVVKAGCVNGGRFHPLEHKALPADAFPRLEYLLRAGDLLVSRASGSLDLIGSAAVIPVDSPTNLMLCDKVYRLAVDSGADASYIAVMLQAHQVRELIKLGVSGAEGMANNLPSSVIRALPVPAAPVEEQRDVVRQAQASSIRTARLADVFERSIAALVEHRQALISAAVTGELDVPEMRENPSHLVCPTTARG